MDDQAIVKMASEIGMRASGPLTWVPDLVEIAKKHLEAAKPSDEQIRAMLTELYKGEDVWFGHSDSAAIEVVKKHLGY